MRISAHPAPIAAAVLALTACNRHTPPVLGMQIDRNGRPDVNNALNNPFNPNVTSQGMAKDQYNSDSAPADWATNWVPTFKQNLAVLDALDGVCGNQLAYASSGRPDYESLAALFASDVLWINTASTTCTKYLAVELNALGQSNDDCGGRTLTYNVADYTYNVVAGTFNAMNPPGPIVNGITAASVAPSTTFPFLVSPH